MIFFQNTINIANLPTIIFCVYALLFVSCSVQNITEESASPSNSKGNLGNNPTKNIDKLYLESGFEIPCLNRIEVTRPKKKISNIQANEPIFGIGYDAKDCKLEDFDIFEKLVKMPRKGWKVLYITSFETKKAIFEYTVILTLDGTNAQSELTYLDTDGDGKFDTVFQSSSLKKPIIPDWLQN